MPVSSWSTSASLNTSVGGVSIAPGMDRANVDNALRALMAEAKAGFVEGVTVTAHGAVADWNGTTGTDNTAAFQAAIATGARNIRVPQGAYKITDTLSLRSGQQLVGEPGALYTVSATSNAQSLIAFRPASGGKAAIKNVNATNGQGVRGISLDLNDATNTAIQFGNTSLADTSGCYGNVIEDVKLWGTFKWGIVLHNTFVCEVSRIDFTGAAIKVGGVYIGDYNDIKVSRLHFSNLPIVSTDRTWGVLCNGGGNDLTLEHIAAQGVTVGIGLISALQDAAIVQPYFENTVCNILLGSSVGGPIGVRIDGGTYSGPYAGHSQYAKRGPMVWARGGGPIRIAPSRIDDTPNAAGANGPWPFLTGTQLTAIEIDACSIFGGTNPESLLMRQNAGDSPGYYVRGYNSGGNNECVELLKRSGTNGSTGAKVYFDNTPAQVVAAYTPTLIGGTVDALLSAAAPATADVVV